MRQVLRAQVWSCYRCYPLTNLTEIFSSCSNTICLNLIDLHALKEAAVSLERFLQQMNWRFVLCIIGRSDEKILKS